MSCWVSMCTVWPPHSKLLSEYGEKSTLNFVLTLNITPQKLFRWCRRPQLWTTGDWQLHHDNTAAHASCFMQSFWQNIKSPRWLSPRYSPDLGLCNFWLFPQLKSPLKGKRFQTMDEIQENTIRQLMAIGRTVWGPKMSTLKGTESSLSHVQRVLYLVSSSTNVSIFHITWLNTFWHTIHTHVYICTHIYVVYDIYICVIYDIYIKSALDSLLAIW